LKKATELRKGKKPQRETSVGGRKIRGQTLQGKSKLGGGGGERKVPSPKPEKKSGARRTAGDAFGKKEQNRLRTKLTRAEGRHETQDRVARGIKGKTERVVEGNGWGWQLDDFHPWGSQGGSREGVEGVTTPKPGFHYGVLTILWPIGHVGGKKYLPGKPSEQNRESGQGGRSPPRKERELKRG